MSAPSTPWGVNSPADVNILTFVTSAAVHKPKILNDIRWNNSGLELRLPRAKENFTEVNHESWRLFPLQLPSRRPGPSK